MAETAPTSIAEWEKSGGVYCPNCGQETVRLFHNLCPQCLKEKEAEETAAAEDKSMKRYYKREMTKGTISISTMREGGI